MHENFMKGLQVVVNLNELVLFYQGRLNNLKINIKGVHFNILFQQCVCSDYYVLTNHKLLIECKCQRVCFQKFAQLFLGIL